MSEGAEGGFNGVGGPVCRANGTGRSDVSPAGGWKIIEREQRQPPDTFLRLLEKNIFVLREYAMDTLIGLLVLGVFIAMIVGLVKCV